MPNTLIIDDDVTLCAMLNALLKKNGHKTKVCYSAGEVKKLVQSEFFDIILTDIRLPDADGMELLQLFRHETPASKVIMLTGYANYNSAIRSIKEGAYSYLPKPFMPDEVLSIINQALKDSSKKEAPPSESATKDASYIAGKSTASIAIQKYIKLVAPTQISVLITGESGTGKEYVAKTIHELSSRANQPFIAVDCGAIPHELVASEFFGHIKGSFTGAHENKTGHFEAANGGTLFLDEVGNLSYNTQIQLLRALQEREIKPVGSSQSVKVDIRLIAATNEDLRSAINKGAFREDLYHRLNEFDFQVPSLTERRDDIPEFAYHFLQKANQYLGKQVNDFDNEAMETLQNYSWPGNLRELSNVIKRSVLLASDNTIRNKDLPENLNCNNLSSNNALRHPEAEKDRIIEVLKAFNNNKTKAAQALQIDRKTLYNKLKLYEIDL